jgi:hypothetical protein
MLAEYGGHDRRSGLTRALGLLQQLDQEGKLDAEYKRFIPLIIQNLSTPAPDAR